MMRARLCVKTGHLINRYNTKGWQAPVICASLSLMAVCSYIHTAVEGVKKKEEMSPWRPIVTGCFDLFLRVSCCTAHGMDLSLHFHSGDNDDISDRRRLYTML
jgi:hypothetical protein